MHVQARGAYTVVVKDGKKFFLKMVGANIAAEEKDITKNFRTAFIQHISDQLAEYLISQGNEVLVICNKKKALADDMTSILNEILDEYGMELVNFYIESIEIPEDDECMKRIRELRIQRQEKMFEREQSMADERTRFGLHRESSEADRYVSGQMAQADYERMSIRDQDGNNGWARQETAGIMREAAGNDGVGGAFVSAGMGLSMGSQMGRMMNQMKGGPVEESSLSAGVDGTSKIICPKCSAVVPNDMKFCGNCGTPITVEKPKCLQCGVELIPGMKFCGNCGQPVVAKKRVCPNCGKEIPEGLKFCGDCGTKIEE